jgi:hypothetical protein
MVLSPRWNTFMRMYSLRLDSLLCNRPRKQTGCHAPYCITERDLHVGPSYIAKKLFLNVRFNFL